MKRLRLSKEDTAAMHNVTNYIHGTSSSSELDVNSEVGLVDFLLTASPLGIKNIDAYLKAMRKPTVSDRLKQMKRSGKPTNLKELGVNGRDLAKAGFKGKEIGDALGYLLNYAIEYNNNDKKHLLDVAKSQYDKS